MPKYLSQTWLDEFQALCQSLPAKGDSARIQYRATDGPAGDIEYYWILEDGRLLEAKLGTLPDAETTLSMSYDNSAKVQRGELDANAAFMQGRVKVDGDVGKLMALLPLTTSPEWKALQDAMQEVTEY